MARVRSFKYLHKRARVLLFNSIIGQDVFIIGRDLNNLRPKRSFKDEFSTGDQTIVLGLQIFLNHRSLSSISQNITFKSSYNWFKIDIRWLLRPPTAIFSHVHSNLNFYIYIIESSNYVQNAFWQSGSDCRWFLSLKR